MDEWMHINAGLDGIQVYHTLSLRQFDLLVSHTVGQLLPSGPTHGSLIHHWDLSHLHQRWGHMDCKSLEKTFLFFPYSFITIIIKVLCSLRKSGKVQKHKKGPPQKNPPIISIFRTVFVLNIW